MQVQKQQQYQFPHTDKMYATENSSATLDSFPVSFFFYSV